MLTQLAVESRIDPHEVSCGQRACEETQDRLKKKIDSLNELIYGIDASIRALIQSDLRMSKTEMKANLEKISTQISLGCDFEKNYFSQKNIFSQKSTIQPDSTLTNTPKQKIYEIPLEIKMPPSPRKLYEVPLDFQKFEALTTQDVEEYFSRIQSWSKIDNSLQACLEKLIKTKSQSLNPYKVQIPAQFSIFKQDLNEYDFEGSFSISEIRKRRVSDSTVRDLCDKEIQTEEQERVMSPRRTLEQKVYIIPTEIQLIDQKKDSQTQTSIQAQSNFREHLVGSLDTDELIGETNIIMESINRLIKKTQSEQNLSAQIFEMKKVEFKGENGFNSMLEARVENCEEEMTENNLSEADEVMTRLTKLLFETPNYLEEEKVPLYTPKSIEQIQEEARKQLEGQQSDSSTANIKSNEEGDEIIQQLNSSLKKLNQIIYQNYEIPIQMRIVEECEKSQDIDVENMMTVEEARISEEQISEKDHDLMELDEKIAKIKRIIKEVPKAVMLQSISYENSEPFVDKEPFDEQWEQVNSNLGQLSSMIKEINDNEIEISEVGSPDKEEVEENVEDINRSITKIQKAISDIPDILTLIKELKLEEKPAIIKQNLINKKKEELIEGRIIDKYEIPVDMEVISDSEFKNNHYQSDEEENECLSDDVTEREVEIRQEIKITEKANITSQQKEVKIRNYAIEYQMEIMEDSEEEKSLEEGLALYSHDSKEMRIQSQVVNELIVSNEAIVAEKQKKKVYEIPLELYVEEEEEYIVEECRGERGEIMELREVETQTDMAEKEEGNEEDGDITLRISEANYPADSLDDSHLSRFYKLGDLEALALKESPTVKNMGNGQVVDLDCSEGNKTDRSFYLHKALNSSISHKNGSITSRFFKEESINAADYYQLQESIKFIEEERDKLIQLLLEADREVNNLHKETKVQQKYINDINCYHDHEKNTFSIEIHSIHQKNSRLQAQLQYKSHMIANLEKDRETLEFEMTASQKEMERKNEMLKHAGEQINFLSESVDFHVSKVREESDERAKMMQEREDQLVAEVQSLKLQINDLKNFNEELEKDNNNLNKKLNEKIVKIDELGEKESELMEGIEKAINEMEDGKSSPENKFKKIYEGEFKKKKKCFEKQISSKETLMNQLQTEKRNLTERLSQIEEQNSKLREGSFLLASQQQSSMFFANAPSSFYQQAMNNTELYFAEEVPSLYSQIPNGVCNETDIMDEMEDLKKEVSRAHRQLMDKENLIVEMRGEIEGLKEKLLLASSPSRKSASSPRKEFSEKYDEASLEYIAKLENVIGVYEQIIQDNQFEIKDLQAHLLEYMEDGLEKEIKLEELEEIIKRASLPTISEEKDEEDDNIYGKINLDESFAKHAVPYPSMMEEPLLAMQEAERETEKFLTFKSSHSSSLKTKKHIQILQVQDTSLQLNFDQNKN